MTVAAYLLEATAAGRGHDDRLAAAAHGAAHATVLLDGLAAWMKRKGFGSIGEVRGMLAAAGRRRRAGYGRSGYPQRRRAGHPAYGPR